MEQKQLTNWLPIGILVGFVTLGIVILFFLLQDPDIEVGVWFGSAGIPGGIIGAYIGRRSKKSAWIGAILGAALGVGCFFSFFMAMVFSQ